MSDFTIKDVARICGVGVSTVSRAINNHPDINQATKDKIMQVIAENNYIPNNSARNLKRSESNTIAILIKGIDNPFFLAMFKIFEQELGMQDYSFILQRVQQEEDELLVAQELSKEKRLKGIIFLGGRVDRDSKELRAISVPYVLCTVAPEKAMLTPEVNYVSIDDEQESFRIVDYLCSLGHKRIAIMRPTCTDRGIGRSRYNGYVRALKKHGIEVDPSLVLYMKDDIEAYTPANGYAVTKELLDSGVEFSALYTMADTTAMGACKALFEAGKRVPEDYSVAGFDGIDMATYYNPSLTTIRQPKEEMARASIKMLLDLIEERQVTNNQRVFEGELWIGESTRKI
ncbi:MAG: LacI family DNA-binding transcriptional regulator [bacterium]|nr:LacI family DNA-binding transcriptional regulator [bacterium]